MFNCEWMKKILDVMQHLRIEKEEKSRHQQQNPGKRSRNVSRLNFTFGHGEWKLLTGENHQPLTEIYWLFWWLPIDNQTLFKKAYSTTLVCSILSKHHYNHLQLFWKHENLFIKRFLFTLLKRNYWFLLTTWEESLFLLTSLISPL